MTQRDLNRAIARATGESVSDIAHMGFSEIPSPSAAPATGIDGEFSDAHDRSDPAILDWDALDALLGDEDPDSEPPLLLVA